MLFMIISVWMVLGQATKSYVHWTPAHDDLPAVSFDEDIHMDFFLPPSDGEVINISEQSGTSPSEPSDRRVPRIRVKRLGVRVG
uniref:Secreted protein n=1 Tax=Caenorhabditis tropicalis TaxID=1561998 RepID=A0A1I7T1U4_9PELO